MQGILQIFSTTYLAHTRLPVQAHPGHGNMMAPLAVLTQTSRTACRVVELLVQLI